ncbi:MAG: hypothetical protein ACOCZQ_00610 [Nanoarchaeota archaeon]
MLGVEGKISKKTLGLLFLIVIILVIGCSNNANKEHIELSNGEMDEPKEAQNSNNFSNETNLDDTDDIVLNVRNPNNNYKLNGSNLKSMAVQSKKDYWQIEIQTYDQVTPLVFYEIVFDTIAEESANERNKNHVLRLTENEESEKNKAWVKAYKLERDNPSDSKDINDTDQYINATTRHKSITIKMDKDFLNSSEFWMSLRTREVPIDKGDSMDIIDHMNEDEKKWFYIK